MNLKSKKSLLIGLVIVIAVALVVILSSSPPTEWVRAQQLGAYIQSLGVLGVGVLFVTSAVATAFGLPRQFFAFVGGFAYGVSSGLILASIGATVGCAMTFYCSRYFLSNRVTQRYPDIVDRLNALMRDDVFLKVLVLRLQPLGTNLITNVCAGVTKIRASWFFAASWVGYLPQMFVFSLLGTGVRIGSNAYVIQSLVMLVVSLIIGYWLYKRAIVMPS